VPDGIGLGEGFITIRPDMTAFTPELEVKVKGALAAINTAGTQNPLENAFAGSASGAQQLDKSVTAAAASIQQKAVPAMKTLGDTTKSATTSVNSANTSITGLQRSVLSLTRLAPVLAAVFSVKLFSDFEKAAQEAGAVFGDSANQVIDFAKNISTQFGLTETAALRFATDFGNALQGIGFSANTAAVASEELTKRTADVAAALSKSPQQIAQAFQLALEGNIRGLKQLGITISATDEANRAAQLGYKGTVAELSDAQKAAVLYSLVLDATNKFQGQAAATADTFAGRLRTFKATVGDTAIAVGRTLAPALEGILAVFTPLIGIIGKLPAPLLAFAAAAGTTALALKALSASALGPFISGLFGAEGAIGGFVAAMGETEGVLAGLEAGFATLNPEIAGVALIVGVATAAFALFQQKTESTAERIRSLGDASLDAAGKFKTLTDVDLHQLINDLNALSNIKAPSPDMTPTVEAIHQLTDAGNDLDKIRSKFTDLLKPEFGTAGLGAAAEVLDALNASGQGQTAIAKELQADFDKEVAARQKANDEAQRGSNILNQDTIVREQNDAAVKEQTSSINDLFTVTDQLTKANQSLADSNDAVAAAQQKIKDLKTAGATQEIADATASLTQANDSLTAALERQVAAQEALADLKAPATEQELSDATDTVTEAQIKLAQAIRARDAAEKALNETTGVTLNLTGLNLRQLGTALAAARASLAAQRATAPTSGATPQETAIEAEINVRKATEDVQKAQDDLNALKVKGTVETDKTVAAEHELTLANNAVTTAQDEVNKRQAKLADLQAGTTQNAKDLVTANKDLATALQHQHDAQQTVNDLTAKQKDDTNKILGIQQLITNEQRNQIRNQQILFAGNANLRRGLVENILATAGTTMFGPFGGPTNVPFTPGILTQGEIDQIFAALTGDPNRLRDLLKNLGLSVPGFAAGGVIDRPTLAWIGEKFRTESVIPWSNTQRVWDVLSQSLPHMPTVVRQRLEPAIPGPEHRISRPTHLNVPYVEIDYDRLGAAVARALRQSGAGADVDIHVHPAPGMSEAQLVRRAKRELGRVWEGCWIPSPERGWPSRDRRSSTSPAPPPTSGPVTGRPGLSSTASATAPRTGSAP
jgi:hypothetical protein